MSGAPLAAREHLVDSLTRDERLAGPAGVRARDMARLVTLLESEPAAKVAASMGLDQHQASVRLAFLTDRELHDLALRSEALHGDPSAGGTGKVLLIVLVVCVVAVGVALLECAGKDNCIP